MREIIMAGVVLCSAGLAAPAASAQQTTGIITGRLIDAQGSAVPGATVTGRHAETGFIRSDVSNREGVYRLAALPVGSYDLTTELQGFATVRH